MAMQYGISSDAPRNLADRKGRIAKKLRISVTDRCNFACLFCMPDREKVRWLPQEDILSFDEIERVTRVLASLGIERIRITGGEPLLRRNLERLIQTLGRLDGIRTIDMTTNGWFLSDKADSLRRAGCGVSPSAFTASGGRGSPRSRGLTLLSASSTVSMKRFGSGWIPSRSTALR